MGCGCKKKKAQLTASQAAQTIVVDQTIKPNETNINAVQETKDYQGKVRDALKQLMDIKRRKRNLRA